MESKKRGKERKKGMGEANAGEMKRRFSVACLRQSDRETTFDRDKISDGDSLQMVNSSTKSNFLSHGWILLYK